MNPFQLEGKTADGKTAKVWACGICMFVCHDEAHANRCCICSYCGKPTEKDKYGNRQTCHSECQRSAWALRDAEKMDKAVEVFDYYGPFLVNDQYCEDMEAVLECYYDCEPDEIPEFVYACKENKPCLHLDLDDLSYKIEDLWEDADWSYFHGVDELEAAFMAFNSANYDRACYNEDCKRKVRVPREAANTKGETSDGVKTV